MPRTSSLSISSITASGEADKKADFGEEKEEEAIGDEVISVERLVVEGDESALLWTEADFDGESGVKGYIGGAVAPGNGDTTSLRDLFACSSFSLIFCSFFF